MGLFSFWRRPKVGADGGGIGNPSLSKDATRDVEPLEPGEGGPSLFLGELADLRWIAQQEAVNVGRQPLEPELWPGGRISLEFERSIAHDHEGLRDRLADYVAAESREYLRDLYESAGEVAESRDALRAADQNLATVLSSWNMAYREVHEDELELGRYFRLRSTRYQFIKIAIAVVILAAEFAITTAVFDKFVTEDNAAFPYLFAIGTIAILILIPHYAAVGLKDGLTKYHEAQMDAHERAGKDPAPSLRKKARLEEVEDTGIKLAAGAIGIALVVLLIPLSVLRAEKIDDPQKWLWFFFFLFVQIAISGYFFLREWMDYGTASANLKFHDESKAEAEHKRLEAFEDYSECIADFASEAEDLLFMFREAPRWDSHIVQTYLGTIHHFRHIVTLQHPDLDVFIKYAEMPYLGRSADVDRSSRALDPVGSEHLELERPDCFGREWWLRQLSSALQEVDPGPRSVDETYEALTTSSPQTLLRDFLSRYYGLAAEYSRPGIFDVVEEINPPEDLRSTDAGVTDIRSKKVDPALERMSRRRA